MLWKRGLAFNRLKRLYWIALGDQLLETRQNIQLAKVAHMHKMLQKHTVRTRKGIHIVLRYIQHCKAARQAVEGVEVECEGFIGAHSLVHNL